MSTSVTKNVKITLVIKITFISDHKKNTNLKVKQNQTLQRDTNICNMILSEM